MRRVLVLLRLLAVASACALVPATSRAQLGDVESLEAPDAPDAPEDTEQASPRTRARPTSPARPPADEPVEGGDDDPWVEVGAGGEQTTDVDLPELLLDPSRGILDGVRIGHIHPHHETARPDGLEVAMRTLQARLAAGEGRHPATSACEAPRGGAADPCGGARDDDDPRSAIQVAGVLAQRASLVVPQP